jgi:hypothetical protein
LADSTASWPKRVVNLFGPPVRPVITATAIPHTAHNGRLDGNVGIAELSPPSHMPAARAGRGDRHVRRPNSACTKMAS